MNKKSTIIKMTVLYNFIELNGLNRFQLIRLLRPLRKIYQFFWQPTCLYLPF
jgi:hypothetical protein